MQARKVVALIQDSSAAAFKSKSHPKGPSQHTDCAVRLLCAVVLGPAVLVWWKGAVSTAATGGKAADLTAPS